MRSTNTLFWAFFGWVLLLVCMLAGHAMAQEDCVEPAVGLISWWPGDGNADDIQNGNEGTLQNGATFAAGMVGPAFSFDGVDDFVSLVNTASMDFGTGDFTIDLWVNFSSIAGDQTLISKVVGVFPNEQIYSLEVDKEGTNDPFIRFLVRDTTTNENDLRATVSLQTGTWYHIAGVRQGNTSFLYLDGNLIGQQIAGNNMDTGSGGIATIGRLAASPTATRFVSGLIDEVELFNRALSAREIQDIVNAGSAGKCKISTIELLSLKDSFLRSGAKHTNEGANPTLRLQAAGHNRVVVAFDLTEIDTERVSSATLILTIVDNADNWGPNDDRTVDAHPLLTDFTEGNGQNAGVPGANATRGTGAGVTWTCAVDSNIANQQANCAPGWNGGTFGPATADPVVHSNGLSGEVSWDVTADVVAGATGWVIKKTQEGQSGQVLYSSKEGPAPPRLLLVLE